MGINVGVYIYIYIYMNVCVGLCVLWVVGGIIFNIFEAAPECLDIPLSILAWRPHKNQCSRKSAKPEESQSVSSETPEQRVRHPERREGILESRSTTRSGDDDDQRWISIFDSYVGFLLSYHDSHTYTQRILKSSNFTFLRFAVLNLCFSVSSFYPLFIVCLFLYILWNAHTSGCEKKTMGSTPLDEWPK